MAKIVVNVRNNDLNDLKDNDILMFDKDNNTFYKVTPEKFFNKYEEKLDTLLKRYDKQFADMKLLNDKFQKDMKIEFNNLLEKNRNTINKLIEMVEEFVQGGK